MELFTEMRILVGAILYGLRLKNNNSLWCDWIVIYLFIWGFSVAFNTVQVISQWVVLWPEETSTYS